VNPRTVFWQSLVTAGLLGAVVVFANPAVVVWLAGAALALAAALNATYAHDLGCKGRSSRRIQGDHLIAQHIAIGLLLPLLGATAAVLGRDRPEAQMWDFSHAETAALLIAPAVLFVIVFLSSLVDWYYIRPRIDAVIGPPPCRASADEKAPWKRVTRRWYLHRGIATLAYIAFALVVALVIMLMLVRRHPAAAAVVGGVSGIAGIILILAGSYRSEIPSVAKCVLQPTFVLGDDLTYDGYGGRRRGYVLHVSVPGVKLVPLDTRGRRTDVPFVERKNSALADADLIARPTSACKKRCAVLNPECLEEPTPSKKRHDATRHWLAL